MTIKAALLNEDGTYERIDELEDASQLTSRHLPMITACDLPPKEYVWVADSSNPHGGAFWHKGWLARVSETKAKADRERLLRDAMKAELSKPTQNRKARRLVSRALRGAK